MFLGTLQFGERACGRAHAVGKVLAFLIAELVAPAHQLQRPLGIVLFEGGR